MRSVLSAILILFIGFSIGINVLVFILFRPIYISNAKKCAIYEKRNSEIENIYKTLSISYPQKKVMFRGDSIIIGLNKYEALSYTYLFRDFADSFKVDWHLFSALIWTESMFNPTLVSKAHCKGLGQFKDSTLMEQCNKNDVKFLLGETTWRDITNLSLSCKYLAEGLNKNQEYALKRYIGGGNYNNQDTVVRNYYKDVMNEFYKLGYIYSGVQNEIKKN